MSKRVLFILLTAALISSLSGCKEIGSTVDTSDGYYAEQRMSEIEYDTFIAKKTSGILDKLAAHAATATNIANGEYLPEDECDNVSVTIKAIDEAYEDILKIGPSIDSEAARDNLLNQLKDAKEHLEAYYESLQDAETITYEIMSDYASKFKNDFTVIKAF